MLLDSYHCCSIKKTSDAVLSAPDADKGLSGFLLNLNVFAVFYLVHGEADPNGVTPVVKVEIAKRGGNIITVSGRLPLAA